MTCETATPLELWRYESRTLTLTVVDPDTGFAVDISTGPWQVLELEFEIKTEIDGADPALVSKAIGTGITLLAQSGDTLGQAEIAIAPADVAMAAGTYYGDVWATFSGGRRSLVVLPFEITVLGVVNTL